MDYVILNGIDSRTIPGLLIQNLPPISKPLMRTDIEEIDGRDGDIITRLGYSAYDKTLEIGLYGSFDINQIIEFFSTRGKVVFSNEPDKYYNYDILDQIDYEKLLRFRTANVNFHCQPFKYPLDEQTVFNAYSFNNYTKTENGVTATVKGNVIKFKGTATAGINFYIPISIALSSGSNSLNVISYGKNATVCKFSITTTTTTPTTATTFGGVSNYFPYNSGLTISDTLSSSQTYITLYVSMESGNEYDFTVSIGKIKSNATFTVTNFGNTFSKPTYTIYGSGDLSFYINGINMLQIALSDEGYISINAETMNASKGGTLKNRIVTGNYENIFLNSGQNTISLTGTSGVVLVENYSRWL